MTNLVTPEGHWAPHSAEKVSHDEPSTVYQMLYRDPYITETTADVAHAARPPVSAWETIRFAFGAWARRIHEIPIPFAEYDWLSRGGDIAQVQSPNVVAGNVAAHGKVDRYGPFKQSALAQQALQDYLASAVPPEVQSYQTMTGA